MTDSRIPHLSGSVSSTFLPGVTLLGTSSSTTSSWACPTRTASTPATSSASWRDAFSGNGSASPYDEPGLEPEWHETMTRSHPACFSRGTITFACSTMPGNFTSPSTLALSQMATPGVTRPRMPTLTGLLPRTWKVRIT